MLLISAQLLQHGSEFVLGFEVLRFELRELSQREECRLEELLLDQNLRFRAAQLRIVGIESLTVVHATEGAFEIARAGACRTVDEVRNLLRAEGYDQRQLEGPALSKQIWKSSRRIVRPNFAKWL